MIRAGDASPLESPLKTRIAWAKKFAIKYSSCTESTATECMPLARDSLVACPSIALLGVAVPFANLAKIEMRGWLTQFGARISCRIGS